MSNAFFKIPTPVNEPVKSYAPGSPERAALKSALEDMNSSTMDIPMYIGGNEVRSDRKLPVNPPHNIGKTVGHFYKSNKEHVLDAIKAARAASADWANM